MQEIRQWNPQDQPAASAAPHADAETRVHRDVEASPSNQGIGLLPAGSPVPSVSPDRSHSHAAASTSSSSHKVQSINVIMSLA